MLIIDIMNEKNKLIKNIIFYTIRQICTILFPMIIYPYVTRKLGVENIGKVEYAKSISQYFLLFAGLGISDYAIREGARIRNDKKKLARFSTQILTIHFVSSLVVSLILITITFSSPFHPYQNLLIIFMLMIPFNFVGTNWIFGIFEDYQYISLRTILFQIISVVLTLILVHSENDFMFYAIILVVSNMGSNILNIKYARRYIKLDFSEFNLKKHIKPILLIFGMSVAGSLYTTMDTSMIGFMIGTISVGYYSAANKLVTIIGTLIGAIRTVFLPRLSFAVGDGDEDSFRKLNELTLEIILMFSIPMAGGILCLNKEIILLFCGNQFLPAATALRLLVPEIILSAVNGYLIYQILMPLKKEQCAFICIATGAGVNLIINVMLIPILHQNGAAIATWISECAVLIMILIFGRKYILVYVKLRSMLKSLLKYLVSGIIMTIICFLIRNWFHEGIIMLSFVLIAGTFSYFIMLLLLHEKNCWLIVNKLWKKY